MTSRVSIPLIICIAAAAVAIYGLTLSPSEPEVQQAVVAEAEASASSNTDTASPSGTAEAAGVAEAAAIEIANFDFTAGVTVSAGQRIDVTNIDSAPHTLTSVDGLFDTGNLGQNDTATITAPLEPGTYAFFCEIHPSMVGELTVEP